MDKIILDAALRARLGDLQTVIDLCDETGRTVGHFVPAESYLKLMYAWAKAEFAGDEKEIQQARQEIRKEGGRLTTAQAVEYLQRLLRNGGQP
jgi:hypothetical protein